MVLCASYGTYNHVTYFDEKVWMTPSLNECWTPVFKTSIVQWVNPSKINAVVTCTADCSNHQPTISGEKIKTFVRTDKFQTNIRIWESKILLDFLDYRFFSILRQKYLYVVICASDGTYNHVIFFDEKLNYEDQPKGMVLEFDILTHNGRVWMNVEHHYLKQVLYNESIQAKLTSWWHVPLIVQITIRQLRNNIKFSQRNDEKLIYEDRTKRYGPGIRCFDP